MASQVLGHHWAGYEKYLSHLFNFFLDIHYYFLVFDTAVSFVNNNIVITMFKIK